MLPNQANCLTSIALCVQAFAFQEGIPVIRIKEITGLAISMIYCIKQIAFERSYNPKVYKEFKDEFFTNVLHSGRPKIIIEENTTKVLELVYKNREERE